MTASDPRSTANVVCVLPSDIRIESVASRFSSECTPRDLDGLWMGGFTIDQELDLETMGFIFWGGNRVDILSGTSRGVEEGIGGYTTEGDICTFDGDFRIGFSETVFFFGLSQDKQTLQGGLVNESGIFKSIVLNRTGPFLDDEPEASAQSEVPSTRQRLAKHYGKLFERYSRAKSLPD